MSPRHPDPTIAAFLVDGGYPDIEAWMLDSDYVLDDGTWHFVDGGRRHPIQPEDAIATAIEASGFTVPTLDSILAIASEQGWNVTSLWNMAREFIDAHGLLPEFVSALRTVQDIENRPQP